MKKKNDEVILVLSPTPWNFPCDYVKQTTFELSKKARVVFFNPLYFPSLKKLATQAEERVSWAFPFKEKNLLYFPSLGYFPFQRFRIIGKLNLLFNLFLFRLFYLFNFGLKKPVFWLFNYDLGRVAKYFNWGKLVVYDRVDQVSSLDKNEKATMIKLDQVLLERANFVFVNSPYALSYVKKFNQNSFLVPCGCLVDLFSGKKYPPEEMKTIKKPIIGFVGSFDFRIDFKVLYELAKRNNQWSFVFVGGCFSDDPAQLKLADYGNWISKLNKLANIYLVPQQLKERIPNFISSFDICLIPYDTTLEFVKGCNPMKLYEYLAMGKPVVSTPIKAVEQYEPTVKIVETAFEAVKAIRAALKEKNNPEEIKKRKKIADENSWEEKVNQMWRKLLNDNLKFN